MGLCHRFWYGELSHVRGTDRRLPVSPRYPGVSGKDFARWPLYAVDRFPGQLYIAPNVRSHFNSLHLDHG